VDEQESQESQARSEPEVIDVVATLLREIAKTRIVELAPHVSTLIEPSGHLIRVLKVPSNTDALAEVIDRCLDQNPPKGSDVILVGGSSRLRSLMEEAVPKAPRHAFVLYHLPEDGQVSALPEKKSQPRIRDLLSQIRVLSPQQIEAVLSKAQEDLRAHQGEARERAEFFGKMGQRKPRVTIALLACIGLVFGLQNLNGFDLETTYAMGALHRESVSAGEWWRVISSGFLHGGFMHVAMNGFVLYLLGGQMERVIGGHRFLVLYFAALLGGSFLSMQFADAATISVGASGAIWGLLGAQLSLALGRPPVVPRSIAESMKPLAKQNLVLNFLISFVPGIDWAAHFGGGIAGGLLLASGFLHFNSEEDGRAGAAVRLAAVACVLTAAVALFHALR